MVQQNPHDQIQQATQLVHQSMESIQSAKDHASVDHQQYVHANEQLRQAEEVLQHAQNQYGEQALQNPQFQQTQELLHNLRQQLQKIERQENRNF
ncbi:hypothetical protein [Oceanobacillus polygoni]|uniref:Thioredoxin-like negative regulator of GroEL n=1 Tax=Oceanobacillus polygoni TaxID=1235259 RepID=A0A9X1CCI2_9BACI|nr:hypothetical protein [Oceanobacillus polygoni]MBP2078759.1 thioredoxin-like negative regulator of GroEL [Oceanobacillus polygoni]